MSERSLAAFKLPSGRHGLSRKHVAENQRWRLLSATAEAFAEEGYLRMTSHGVAKRAAVSSSTLYEQFRGRDGCLLAAFEACAEEISICFTTVEETPGDRGALRRLVHLFEREPAFARLLGLELRAAVPATAEPFRRLVDALTSALLERAASDGAPPAAMRLRLQLWVVGGLTFLGMADWGGFDVEDLAVQLERLLPRGDRR
ncbi:MAG: TetR/AcrR family transcriptional regulator [Solirubrobacterales bacterium]